MHAQLKIMTDSYTLEIADSPSFSDLMVERKLGLYNREHGFEPVVELAAFVYDRGVVKGGVYGELGWGWLYVDLAWVDDSLRGQGYGARLMAAIEQEALARGVGRAHLSTTSFQSLEFYYTGGYRLFGVLEDRPPGYLYYYLRKEITPVSGEDLLPPVVEDPDPADFQILREGLKAHTASMGVDARGERLAVFLRAGDGSISGGLIGATYWGWLDMQVFWVDASLRGQGFGTEMLAVAEQESVRRGCPYAFVDVSDFQALGFFHKRGYDTFATLEDYPPGHTMHFLKKELGAK